MATEITTLKGTAVAIVALARFISSQNSGLTLSLRRDLQNAELAGVDPSDLELLRIVIDAAQSCSGTGAKRF